MRADAVGFAPRDATRSDALEPYCRATIPSSPTLENLDVASSAVLVARRIAALVACAGALSRRELTRPKGSEEELRELSVSAVVARLCVLAKVVCIALLLGTSVDPLLAL